MPDQKPIPTAILAPDGLRPTPYTVYSLNEAVSYEPQGVYTLARTFHGDHALLFDAHLDRLEQSAQLVNIPLRLDRPRLRAALRDLLHQAGYPDSKFRLTVPAGEPECIYIALEPFVPVPEVIQQHGAHVITVPVRRPNPVVKTTAWMTARRPTYDRLPPSVYEGVMVGQDGVLLEGLSSNFYAILDGELRTAGSDVLAGITRLAICEIAPRLLPVNMTGVHLDDLPRLSEAMLTSSGRGVVPITRINDQPVGDGKVGPIVDELRRRYNEWAEAHIEPI